MRNVLIIVFSTLAVLAYGCANEPELRPAADADRIKGPDKGATATDADVTIEARVGAWRFTPQDLDHELTPVLVRIENNSDKPLRVRYEAFQLVTPRGLAFAALPPFDIHGEVSEYVGNYAYAGPGFSVAPHLSGYYDGFGAWGAPFYGYDWYYSTYYPVYADFELPTGDMLIRALPEGVIEPDGRITGFLYFADLEAMGPTPGKVKLRYLLVNAETRQRFGVIEIPFDVVED